MLARVFELVKLGRTAKIEILVQSAASLPVLRSNWVSFLISRFSSGFFFDVFHRLGILSRIRLYDRVNRGM